MHLSLLWTNARSAVNARWGLRAADSIGPRVRLKGRVLVINEGRLVIEARVQIFSTIAMTELVTGPNGTLEIGDRTFINSGCSIAARQLVHIGPDCQIGPHTMILDNDYHRLEPERRMEMPESQSVVIEENVWIGGRAIILPGVTVGAGSCVGAGSVVTHDVPARTFVAGVPAQAIKSL